MALPLEIEKRREYRDSRFRDGVTLVLVPNDSDEIQITIRPLDVSKRGLGFYSNQRLEPGAFFWLVIGDERFRVELAYCSTHLGIEDLFCCGLFLREADGDLKNHCLALGLMDAEYDEEE